MRVTDGCALDGGWLPTRRDLEFTLFLLTETSRTGDPFTVGTFVLSAGLLAGSTDLALVWVLVLAIAFSAVIGSIVWVFLLEPKCRSFGVEADLILRANPALLEDMGELSLGDPEIREASRQFMPVDS